MIMNAIVLSGEVLTSTFYDQATGAPKSGHSVKLTVLDVDTDEKYDCQLTDGFTELEQLKELKRQGASSEDLEQVVQQLRAHLPPKMASITLDVRRIKGKGSFLTLVCRFAQVMASV